MEIQAPDQIQEGELAHTVKRMVRSGIGKSVKTFAKYAGAVLLGMSLCYVALLLLTAASRPQPLAAAVPPPEVEVHAPLAMQTDVWAFRGHGIFHDKNAHMDLKVNTSNGDILSQYVIGNNQKLRLREDHQGYTWEGYLK